MQQRLLKKIKSNQTKEYSFILKKHRIKYSDADENYYRISKDNIEGFSGWTITISCIRQQIVQMLHIVLPILVAEKTCFAIVKNEKKASQILDGDLGFDQIGKILKIYPSSDRHAEKIAKKISQKTNHIRGPKIPAEIQLYNTLYTKYCPKESTKTQQKVSKKGEWPFSKIPQKNKEHKNAVIQLNDEYLTISFVKKSIKGNVYKALKIENYKLKLCIIKEGKHEMFVDNSGRDIQDRLIWQFKTQNYLKNKLNIPHALNLFKTNDNTYLAMEYIRGKKIGVIINNFYKNKTWSTLELKTKNKLINILVSIINTIEKLHTLGYVHRDITPDNFLLKKNNQLYLIDMELSYSIKNSTPNPPFGLGTKGFMSPEQIKNITPTINEDIYAIGAIMYFFFTNRQPTSLIRENNNEIEGPMKPIIDKCLTHNPKHRPSIEKIKTELNLYQKRINSNNILT